MFTSVKTLAVAAILAIGVFTAFSEAAAAPKSAALPSDRSFGRAGLVSLGSPRLDHAESANRCVASRDGNLTVIARDNGGVDHYRWAMSTVDGHGKQGQFTGGRRWVEIRAPHGNTLIALDVDHRGGVIYAFARNFNYRNGTHRRPTIFLRRIDFTGIPDRKFGIRGIGEVTAQTAHGFLTSELKVLADGRIALYEDFAGDALHVALFDAHGRLSKGLATAGVLTFEGSIGSINGGPDDSLFVRGIVNNGSTGTFQAVLAKYSAGGYLDPGFGNAGLFSVPPMQSQVDPSKSITAGFVDAVLPQANGHIVGLVQVGGPGDWGADYPVWKLMEFDPVNPGGPLWQSPPVYTVGDIGDAGSPNVFAAALHSTAGNLRFAQIASYGSPGDLYRLSTSQTTVGAAGFSGTHDWVLPNAHFAPQTLDWSRNGKHLFLCGVQSKRAKNHLWVTQQLLVRRIPL